MAAAGNASFQRERGLLQFGNRSGILKVDMVVPLAPAQSVLEVLAELF